MKKEINNISYKDIKEIDNKIIVLFKNIFKGYQPSELVEGVESKAILHVTKNKNGTYKYCASITNAALSAGDTNVDIGNSALANDIHERTHDIVNQLALKRAGIIDMNNVSPIQHQLFVIEKNKICQDVYIACFNDETFDDIQKIIEKEISKRARFSGNEFISESMVKYLGAKKKTELAEKVYNYLVKEWDDVQKRTR